MHLATSAGFYVVEVSHFRINASIENFYIRIKYLSVEVKPTGEIRPEQEDDMGNLMAEEEDQSTLTIEEASMAEIKGESPDD